MHFMKYFLHCSYSLGLPALSRVWQHVNLSDVSLGIRPRYSLVVDEDVKILIKQTTSLAMYNVTDGASPTGWKSGVRSCSRLFEILMVFCGKFALAFELSYKVDLSANQS